MKTNSWLVLLALLAATPVVVTADEEQTLLDKTKRNLAAPAMAAANAEELAVVRDNLNVRGQPAFVGEIVTRLKKGEEVTILEEITLEKPKPGEPSKWAKIKMPANTPVWVSSLFIDPVDKRVLSKRLNVRAGPSENHSVVGRLEQGAVVKEISTKGDWLEIELPGNAYAFVAADLLEKKELAPKSDQIAAAVPTPLPPAPKPNMVTPTPASPPPKTEEIPVTKVAVAPAPPAPPIPRPPVENSPVSQTPEVVTSSAVSRPIMLTPMPAAPLVKRIVRREGFIGGTVSIQAPTHFELESLESGAPIDYLHTTSTNFALKELKGKKVYVTGEEYVDKRWPKTPVIEIDTLEPLDD
ncbi:MAG: SH3 domain-containing protein [Verrucomicrobiota bacterium]